MPGLKTKLLFIFSTLLYLLSSTVIPTFAAISYTYDADGNMTSDSKYCYSYNEENQLVTVKNCGNNQIIAQYVYDYQGNRLIKKNYVNGTLSNTVYSPSDEYETKKIASSGAVENTTYYFANNQQIAKKNPNGSIEYIHNDDLGSSSVLTDAAGAVVEKTTYDPWGEVTAGGTKDKFQYTGQEKDSETGLSYYNSRYYNPHIRRFVQPDTLLSDIYNPQTLNRYSYVNNNPLRYTDPSGHFASLLLNPITWLVGAIAAMTIYAVVPKVRNTVNNAVANFAKSTGSTVSKGASVAAQGSMNNWNNFHNQVNKVLGNDNKNSGNSQPNSSAQYHGNDLRNVGETTGYTLRDIDTNVIKKIGQSLDTKGRYSQVWLDNNNLKLVEEIKGTKFDMRVWEHEQIGNYLFENGEAPALNDISRSVNVFR